MVDRCVLLTPSPSADIACQQCRVEARSALCVPLSPNANYPTSVGCKECSAESKGPERSRQAIVCDLLLVQCVAMKQGSNPNA